MVSITFLVPPCWPACVTGLFIPCHILQIKPHSQHHNFWEWMLRHYQFINDTLETSGLYYKAKRHHRRENKSRVAAAKTVPERYHKKTINWIWKVNIHEDNWKGHTHTHTYTTSRFYHWLVASIPCYRQQIQQNTMMYKGWIQCDFELSLRKDDCTISLVVSPKRCSYIALWERLKDGRHKFYIRSDRLCVILDLRQGVKFRKCRHSVVYKP